jgi:hypothetical protein
MTETESHLQAAIDAAPLTGLRMILADHLDEIGDERADGYRALEICGLWPYQWAGGKHWDYTLGHPNDYQESQVKTIFDDEHAGMVIWFDQFWPRSPKVFYAPSRREADDAAALGWAKLPPEVQRDILEYARGKSELKFTLQAGGLHLG